MAGDAGKRTWMAAGYRSIVRGIALDAAPSSFTDPHASTEQQHDLAQQGVCGQVEQQAETVPCSPPYLNLRKEGGLHRTGFCTAQALQGYIAVNDKLDTSWCSDARACFDSV